MMRASMELDRLRPDEAEEQLVESLDDQFTPRQPIQTTTPTPMQIDRQTKPSTSLPRSQYTSWPAPASSVSQARPTSARQQINSGRPNSLAKPRAAASQARVAPTSLTGQIGIKAQSRFMPYPALPRQSQPVAYPQSRLFNASSTSASASAAFQPLASTLGATARGPAPAPLLSSQNRNASAATQSRSQSHKNVPTRLGHSNAKSGVQVGRTSFATPIQRSVPLPRTRPRQDTDVEMQTSTTQQPRTHKSAHLNRAQALGDPNATLHSVAGPNPRSAPQQSIARIQARPQHSSTGTTVPMIVDQESSQTRRRDQSRQPHQSNKQQTGTQPLRQVKNSKPQSASVKQHQTISHTSARANSSAARQPKSSSEKPKKNRSQAQLQSRSHARSRSIRSGSRSASRPSGSHASIRTLFRDCRELHTDFAIEIKRRQQLNNSTRALYETSEKLRAKRRDHQSRIEIAIVELDKQRHRIDNEKERIRHNANRQWGFIDSRLVEEENALQHQCSAVEQKTKVTLENESIESTRLASQSQAGAFTQQTTQHLASIEAELVQHQSATQDQDVTMQQVSAPSADSPASQRSREQSIAASASQSTAAPASDHVSQEALNSAQDAFAKENQECTQFNHDSQVAEQSTNSFAECCKQVQSKADIAKAKRDQLAKANAKFEQQSYSSNLRLENARHVRQAPEAAAQRLEQEWANAKSIQRQLAQQQSECWDEANQRLKQLSEAAAIETCFNQLREEFNKLTITRMQLKSTMQEMSAEIKQRDHEVEHQPIQMVQQVIKEATKQRLEPQQRQIADMQAEIKQIEDECNKQTDECQATEDRTAAFKPQGQAAIAQLMDLDSLLKFFEPLSPEASESEQQQQQQPILDSRQIELLLDGSSAHTVSEIQRAISNPRRPDARFLAAHAQFVALCREDGKTRKEIVEQIKEATREILQSILESTGANQQPESRAAQTVDLTQDSDDAPQSSAASNAESAKLIDALEQKVGQKLTSLVSGLACNPFEDCRESHNQADNCKRALQAWRQTIADHIQALTSIREQCRATLGELQLQLDQDRFHAFAAAIDKAARTARHTSQKQSTVAPIDASAAKALREEAQSISSSEEDESEDDDEGDAASTLAAETARPESDEASQSEHLREEVDAPQSAIRAAPEPQQSLAEMPTSKRRKAAPSIDASKHREEAANAQHRQQQQQQQQQQSMTLPFAESAAASAAAPAIDSGVVTPPAPSIAVKVVPLTEATLAQLDAATQSSTKPKSKTKSSTSDSFSSPSEATVIKRPNKRKFNQLYAPKPKPQSSSLANPDQSAKAAKRLSLQERFKAIQESKRLRQANLAARQANKKSAANTIADPASSDQAPPQQQVGATAQRNSATTKAKQSGTAATSALAPAPVESSAAQQAHRAALNSRAETAKATHSAASTDPALVSASASAAPVSAINKSKASTTAADALTGAKVKSRQSTTGQPVASLAPKNALSLTQLFSSTDQQTSANNNLAAASTSRTAVQLATAHSVSHHMLADSTSAAFGPMSSTRLEPLRIDAQEMSHATKQLAKASQNRNNSGGATIQNSQTNDSAPRKRKFAGIQADSLSTQADYADAEDDSQQLQQVRSASAKQSRNQTKPSRPSILQSPEPLRQSVETPNLETEADRSTAHHQAQSERPAKQQKTSAHNSTAQANKSQLKAMQTSAPASNSTKAQAKAANNDVRSNSHKPSKQASIQQQAKSHRNAKQRQEAPQSQPASSKRNSRGATQHQSTSSSSFLSSKTASATQRLTKRSRIGSPKSQSDDESEYLPQSQEDQMQDSEQEEEADLGLDLDDEQSEFSPQDSVKPKSNSAKGSAKNNRAGKQQNAKQQKAQPKQNKSKPASNKVAKTSSKKAAPQFEEEESSDDAGDPASQPAQQQQQLPPDSQSSNDEWIFGASAIKKQSDEQQQTQTQTQQQTQPLASANNSQSQSQPKGSSAKANSATNKQSNQSIAKSQATTKSAKSAKSTKQTQAAAEPEAAQVSSGRRLRSSTTKGKKGK